MKRLIGFFSAALLLFIVLYLTGCGTAPAKTEKPEEISPVAQSAKSLRHMIVFVPLTDEDTASWLALFSRYPRLRMIVAMSPRFKQFEKRPDLKAQVDELIKAGRIELAMQLSNPPLLPPIAEINADDIVQLVARAKAEYFKTWKMLPQGFVLPYGAISPALNQKLERLGFLWVIAAMGTPDPNPLYRSGPITLWDATPAVDRADTLIRVWDDRSMKTDAPESRARKPLESWAQELQKRDEITPILPSDLSLPAGSLPPGPTWRKRTWTTPDWSAWMNTPAKDAAWDRLRQARQALETFKNSGQASVKRLDMAYEEYVQAANASYFSAIGNPALPAATAEDREREFNVTLASIYKILGQNPPDNLFAASSAAPGASSPKGAGSSAMTVAVLGPGHERITIPDPAGDSRGGASAAFDLRGLKVESSSSTLDITVSLAAVGEAKVDVYIDLNHTPHAGTSVLLPGVGLSASSADAWEYAVRLSSTAATLFRTQAGGAFEMSGTFIVTMKGSDFAVSLPRDVLRGNPSRWGYQVITLAPGIADVLDPPGMTQAAFFETVDAGIRSDIPFIRR